MNYKLQDLIDMRQFQSLQDRLNLIYSFPSAIIDNDGNVLTATAWQDICTKFHRQHADCLKECIKSDQYIVDHLPEANPAVSYRCPHGLVDNATPIIIDGVHYGNFFTGQFFLEKPDLDFFRAQAKQFGFPEEEYLAAVAKVPIWTRAQVDHYLSFIKELIAVISESGLKKLREIENRKRIEEAEERRHLILETAMDGFWLTDMEGRLLEVNNTYCRMSGYSVEELLTMRTQDVEVIESAAETEAHIRRVVTQGEDRFESRHRRKDGSEFDVEVSVQYRPSAAGGRFVAFLRDVTSRKRVERDLREGEERYRNLFERANEGIFLLSTEGKIISVNESFARMHGYSAAEMQNMDLVALDTSETAGLAPERIRRLLAGETLTFQVEHYHRDGHVFPLEVSASKIVSGGRTLIQCFHRDITERRRTEDALRLTSFGVNSASDAIFWITPDARLVEVNDSACRSLGYTREELLQLSVPDVDPHYSAERWPQHFAELRQRGSMTFESEQRRKDGRLFPVEIVANYVSFGGEERNCAFVRDITKRQQAAAALRESEQRFRDLVDSSEGIVWEVDVATFAFTSVSRNAERMLGYPVEEWLQPDFWTNHLHPEDRERTVRYCVSCTQKQQDHDFEYRFMARDGRVVWLRDIVKVVSQDGRPRWLRGLMVDITAQKQADARLHELLQEKESLLREVHHRVKNNLQVITSLLRLEAGRSDHPATKTVLQEMKGRVLSMALLHESLYRSGTFGVVELGSYLRQLSIHSFRTQLVRPGSVQLHQNLASVEIDLDQALPCGLIANELVANALKHGFPEGHAGEVRVELQPVPGGSDFRLRVSDTGVGLPPDFEARRSRALGLQLVHNLARQIDGRLETGAGPGAVFEVIFTPRKPKAGAPAN